MADVTRGAWCPRIAWASIALAASAAQTPILRQGYTVNDITSHDDDCSRSIVGHCVNEVALAAGIGAPPGTNGCA